MLALARQSADDDFGRARRLQLAGRHLVTLDRLHLGDIQIAVAEANAGGAAFAERFLHVEMAVALGVAQCDDATFAVPSVLERDVDVAIGGNCDMPCRSQAIGGDDGAKSSGQRDSAVIRIAGRWRCCRQASGDKKSESKLG